MKVGRIALSLAWAGAMFSLVPSISGYYQSADNLYMSDDSSFLSRMLGQFQSVVSAKSVLQADLYYHGGVEHSDEDELHIITDNIGDRKERGIDGRAENTEYLHTENVAAIKTGKDVMAGRHRGNVLFRIREGLDLSEHKHLEGQDIKEIIPWLTVAMKTDPGNVQSYILASFFLTGQFGKTEEALGLLKQGLRHNPDSWKICAEIGNVNLKYTGDTGAAIRYLLRAKRDLQTREHESLDDRYVLSLLAKAYRDAGEKEKAAEVYKRLAILFPEEKAFRDKDPGNEIHVGEYLMTEKYYKKNGDKFLPDSHQRGVAAGDKGQ